MKSVFDPIDVHEILNRINQLTPETPAKWGKMNVAQMLAHCNVSYEMIYENIHPKPNPILKLFLKLVIKNKVVTEKPYAHNSPTAPAFIISDAKQFEKERTRLINHINQTLANGPAYFDGRESHSFGKLNVTEWNNMLYKHLDHHLSQFGV
ncbi:MAG: hypothetical protein RLY89_2262 [Bacteroidota bacterium]